jgi:hypothetical protein
VAKLIVVAGMDQLLPAERWPRLIAPLAEELQYSGLGECLDLESLRREAAQRGGVEAAEVAVTLANFGYGLPLVRRIVAGAGIRPCKPVVPLRWREYNCADYFTSTLSENGYWDEAGQYWYMLPAERVYEDTDLQFLVIGDPGVDGIDWGYRRGQPGLWAHPIDGEYKCLAPTVEALLQGYLSGAVSI